MFLFLAEFLRFIHLTESTQTIVLDVVVRKLQKIFENVLKGTFPQYKVEFTLRRFGDK